MILWRGQGRQRPVLRMSKLQQPNEGFSQKEQKQRTTSSQELSLAKDGRQGWGPHLFRRRYGISMWGPQRSRQEDKWEIYWCAKICKCLIRWKQETKNDWSRCVQYSSRVPKSHCPHVFRDKHCTFTRNWTRKLICNSNISNVSGIRKLHQVS